MMNNWVCAEEPCPDPMEVPQEWFVCPSDAQWCLDDLFDMMDMEGDHDMECPPGENCDDWGSDYDPMEDWMDENCAEGGAMC